MKKQWKLLSMVLTSAFLFSTQAHAELSKSYEACMNQAESTADMVECNENETIIQDKKLNLAYQKVIKGLKGKEKLNLIKTQRAWIKYRDSEIDRLSNQTGGTIDALNASSFYLKFTAERAEELSNHY